MTISVRANGVVRQLLRSFPLHSCAAILGRMPGSEDVTRFTDFYGVIQSAIHWHVSVQPLATALQTFARRRSSAS
jgi:hypothetical protein